MSIDVTPPVRVEIRGSAETIPALTASYGLVSVRDTSSLRATVCVVLVRKCQQGSLDVLPVVHFEPRKYLLYVIAGRIQAERKRPCDFLVALAARNKQRDLPLLRGEPRGAGTAYERQGVGLACVR